MFSLVPGVPSRLVDHRGLRVTPVAVATLGELAFPLTALSSTTSPSARSWSASAVAWFSSPGGHITTDWGRLRANGTPTGVEVPQLERLDDLLIPWADLSSRAPDWTRGPSLIWLARAAVVAYGPQLRAMKQKRSALILAGLRFRKLKPFRSQHCTCDIEPAPCFAPCL